MIASLFFVIKKLHMHYISFTSRVSAELVHHFSQSKLDIVAAGSVGWPDTTSAGLRCRVSNLLPATSTLALPCAAPCLRGSYTPTLHISVAFSAFLTYFKKGGGSQCFYYYIPFYRFPCGDGIPRF